MRFRTRARSALERTRISAAVLRGINRLRLKSLGSPADLKSRAQSRWQGAEPDVGLTWGREISGDAFVAKMTEYGAFGPDAVIVEVGPGYGRIPDAVVKIEAQFKSYVGVDISPNNVEFLSDKFADDPRFNFIHADAESATLGVSPNVLVSSLVLKHLYPSFELALKNMVGQMQPRSTLIFDLIEGVHQHFQEETFIRSYTQKDARSILASIGCEVIAFDEVVHTPEYPRLLVVAKTGSTA